MLGKPSFVFFKTYDLKIIFEKKKIKNIPRIYDENNLNVFIMIVQIFEKITLI